jgi:DNA-binding SARP family transcriptional activator
VSGPELPTAERLARELTQRAPFRESGYCLLMQTLAMRGQRAEALRVYSGLQQLLRDELGATPSATVQRLHEQLLRGQAGPSHTAPERAGR